MKAIIGQMAPDFTAPIADGEQESEITLSALRGETVVLVFYPKDSTPGCTIQACSLRDHWSEISQKARVFGISADPIASHLKFIRKQNLPYPLISDVDQSICEAYGVWVLKKFMGKTYMGIERSTFVIDPEGCIQAIIEKVSPATHTDQLLSLLP